MFAVADRVVSVAVDDLIDDGANSAYHAPFDANGRDAWLLADVAAHGVLVPLIVHADGRTIHDGRRRCAAAKRACIESVPCVVLEHGDDAAFASAQLARELSLFAKCRLYRGRIEALIEQGEENRASLKRDLLPGDRSEAIEALDEAWVQVEEVLGVGRKSLRQGVKLLAALEDTPDKAFAEKALNVFRDRGLRPAQRLFYTVPVEDDDDTPDDSPDCGTWSAHENLTPIKRSAPKPGHTPKPRKKCAAKPAPCGPEPSPCDWRADCRGMLEYVESQFREHGLDAAPFALLYPELEKKHDNAGDSQTCA